MAKMRKALVLVSLLALSIPALGSIATAPAIAGEDDKFHARLTSYQEVPTLSTTGRGQFRATLTSPTTLSFELKYELLEGGNPTAAHIHLGQRATNGGIIADLCGGLKPVCPAQPATVTGTIVPADVVGPAAQGIAPGEFAELIKAMRAEVTYANVHNATYPGGEIRGQIDD